MADRSFQMQLRCRYEDPDNSVTSLCVRSLDDGAWQDFELTTRSPGFLVFVYAVFSCQHLYFRANCAERGLMLESADGLIDAVTTEEWSLKILHVHFDGKLKGGTPTQGDVDYIVGRMKQCPVSKNTIEPADSSTTVKLS